MCLYFLNELKMHRQPDVLYYVHLALTSCWNNFLWFNVLGTPFCRKICLGNSFHVKPNCFLVTVSLLPPEPECSWQIILVFKGTVTMWKSGGTHGPIIPSASRSVSKLSAECLCPLAAPTSTTGIHWMMTVGDSELVWAFLSDWEILSNHFPEIGV